MLLERTAEGALTLGKRFSAYDTSKHVLPTPPSPTQQSLTLALALAGRGWWCAVVSRRTRGGEGGRTWEE